MSNEESGKWKISTDQNVPSSRGRPNSELTEEEKEAKRRLKKRVKIQSKIKSLRKTVRHAQRRKDADAERKAQHALKQIFKKEKTIVDEMNLNHDVDNQDENDSSCIDHESDYALALQAQPLILEISNILFSCPAAQEALVHEQGGATRETQTLNAVKLLNHMTKGTQELSMFKDKSALWGYTRQKFYERALLLCMSLGKIHVKMAENTENDEILPKNEFNCPIKAEQIRIRKKISKVITEQGIRSACSIGCGPGNDAVGLISFLRLVSGKSKDVLDEILLLDWCMEEWKSTVVDPLIGILTEDAFVKNGIKSSFCDVCKDIDHEANVDAKEYICVSTQNSRETDLNANHDLYLVSYLLTETRGKWESFFCSLVNMAKQDSLFYFAEPIPWQLHRLIELFDDVLDFVWLDSSMDHPGLQAADRRAGPGVLFAIKR